MDSDRSLIVELLERAPVDDADAVAYLFHDLAEANGCDAPELAWVEQVETLGAEATPACPEASFRALLCGRQRAAKFKEVDEARNDVRVYLLLLRLARFETDMLVTLNAPVTLAQASSSAAALQAWPQERAATDDERLVMLELARSLRIADHGLFGGTEE